MDREDGDEFLQVRSFRDLSEKSAEGGSHTCDRAHVGRELRQRLGGPAKLIHRLGLGGGVFLSEQDETKFSSTAEMFKIRTQFLLRS